MSILWLFFAWSHAEAQQQHIKHQKETRPEGDAILELGISHSPSAPEIKQSLFSCSIYRYNDTFII